LEIVPKISQAINKITWDILKPISLEQNEALMRPISIEEVDQEMKQMPAGKASGPDGFTIDFFHHY